MDVITSRVEYRSSVFIKTVFVATFSFSNILSITQATLNQIDNIKSFTIDRRFDVVGLTCRMKSVLMTAMFKHFMLPDRGWKGDSSIFLNIIV